MRIAVCISGQPRTWRTAADNIKKYFNVDAEVDYFIHTWDTNSYRNCDEVHTMKQDYLYDKNEIIEIQKTFNPAAIEISEYTYEKYGKNWCSLFFSFMKSVALKRKYEIENDFLYDIVIKTRFDINFFMEGISNLGNPFNSFYIHKLRPMVAYSANNSFSNFPSELNYHCFDDVFFYADSPTMDIMSNLYRWNLDIMRKGEENLRHGKFVEDPEFYCGPGTLLYRYLNLWNIHKHNETSIPYYVVRKEAEERGLHSVMHWSEIQKISMKYYDNITKAENKKNNLI
jgi:hypothetical protein